MIHTFTIMNSICGSQFILSLPQSHFSVPMVVFANQTKVKCPNSPLNWAKVKNKLWGTVFYFLLRANVIITKIWKLDHLNIVLTSSIDPG